LYLLDFSAIRRALFLHSQRPAGKAAWDPAVPAVSGLHISPFPKNPFRGIHRELLRMSCLGDVLWSSHDAPGGHGGEKLREYSG
jgi:hypothetical protein